MAGGGETTRGRASGEEVIAMALTARGVKVMPHARWARERANDLIAVREFPFTTIYQTAGVVDFLLFQDGTPTVTIEVKHQGVSGSCDEKIPYVLLNGLFQWPTAEGILVLSGDHWTTPRGAAATAAMQRLAVQLAPAGRQFRIFDMTAATNWISRRY
jgi:hypothetical protein